MNKRSTTKIVKTELEKKDGNLIFPEEEQIIQLDCWKPRTPFSSHKFLIAV